MPLWHNTKLTAMGLRMCHNLASCSWNAATPMEVVQRVSSRAADVYLGVDVWGRGTYAGGKVCCEVTL
jgi:mannosyl-glycoprotein endo-beta-N-acetylglucosaminidase